MLCLYQVLGDEDSLPRWEVNEPIRVIVVCGAYFYCLYELFWYSEVPGGSDNDPRSFHSSNDAGSLTSRQAPGFLTLYPCTFRPREKSRDRDHLHSYLVSSAVDWSIGPGAQGYQYHSLYRFIIFSDTWPRSIIAHPFCHNQQGPSESP